MLAGLQGCPVGGTMNAQVSFLDWAFIFAFSAIAFRRMREGWIGYFNIIDTSVFADDVWFNHVYAPRIIKIGLRTIRKATRCDSDYFTVFVY